MIDRNQRDQIIEDHTAFVRRVVGKTVRVLSLPTKNLDEYISAGYLGLVEAADRYNLTQGVAFKSYAYLRIRGAVIDHIRAHSDLRGAAYRRARALRSIESLEQRHIAKLSETADSTEKLETVFNFAAISAMSFRLSGEESQAIFDEMPSETKNPEEALLYSRDAQTLVECIKELPEKERLIIEELYLRGKSFGELLHERPDLSKSWLSRLHSRALLTLTRLVREHYDEAA